MEKGETKPTADSRSSRPGGLRRMGQVDSNAEKRTSRPSGLRRVGSLKKPDTPNTPFEKKNNEESSSKSRTKERNRSFRENSIVPNGERYRAVYPRGSR